MGRTAGTLKLVIEGAFYAIILTLLASRTVSANISHDENQFVAPGQLLADQGLLPYVDYPYLHMPYGIPFYALSAWISDYDLLAGRLLSTAAWLGSILLIVAVARALRSTTEKTPSWRQLLWEFLLVFAFINAGVAQFAFRTALNHSLAALFSLLAVWTLLRGIYGRIPESRAAFTSGLLVSVAGLIRFNYASLLIVLLAGWLIHSMWLRRSGFALAGRYLLGALTASLPALALAAAAPRQFYYGNGVYIRLNTVYYEQLLRQAGMSLDSKLLAFVQMILARPLDLVLYGVLVFVAAVSIVRLVRRSTDPDLGRFVIAGAAAALWVTAFTPTPAMQQYFAAPLPFLFVLLAAFEFRVVEYRTLARAAGASIVFLAMIFSIGPQNPVRELAALAKPKQWHPIQEHELAMSLRSYVSEGRVLTLQSMVPLEVGLEVYPFTAAGPFSWRTSLLLTPERRAAYEVISPEELPDVLEKAPPRAILTGFEASNAGFGPGEMGALERPFTEYALNNGYEAVELIPPFLPRGLTLWIRR